MKNSIDTIGNRTRFVAQCLNQLRQRVLQLIKLKFLRVATNIISQQILEDLEVHFLRTTSELAESFCPKLAYVGAYSFGYLRRTGTDGGVTKVA